MASSVVAVVPERPSSRPYLALGLTFLLLGVGFACPIRLAPQPPAHMWDGAISREVLNLYAVTAFAGWSHFVYAWRGQWMGSRRFAPGKRALYWLAVLAVLALLIGLRSLLGLAVFSLLAWVYNISHFVKAEVYFSAQRNRRAAFFAPVLAFGWFTLCLFRVGPLGDVRFVFAGSVLLAALTLWFGGWKMLAQGEWRLSLLSLFLLGETLVWGAYSPYMTDAFRVGVYVFHIAAASFYHYLTAYFFAESQHRPDRLIKPSVIVIVNLAVFLLGITVAWLPAMHWLTPALGLQWFTLWVALHLAASDLMPIWKRG